jgi:hypothetical protein
MQCIFFLYAFSHVNREEKFMRKIVVIYFWAALAAQSQAGGKNGERHHVAPL